MARDLIDRFVDELMADLLDEADEDWDAAAPRGFRFRTRTRAQVGPYRQVGGHHVHQSASYGREGDPRRTNPHHREAPAIAHGPGFTREQHRRADSVQRRLNRALLGRQFRADPSNPVTITARGEGRLGPTPNPWFEDLKAYYGLRAARPAGYETPQAALELVERSARALERRGARPRRIPRHGR